MNYHIPEKTRFLSKQVFPVIKILILCLMIEVVDYYTVMSEVSLFIFFVGKCCTCRIVIRQMVYCCFSVNGCIYRFGQWFKPPDTFPGFLVSSPSPERRAGPQPHVPSRNWYVPVSSSFVLLQETVVFFLCDSEEFVSPNKNNLLTNRLRIVSDPAISASPPAGSVFPHSPADNIPHLQFRLIYRTNQTKVSSAGTNLLSDTLDLIKIYPAINPMKPPMNFSLTDNSSQYNTESRKNHHVRRRYIVRQNPLYPYLR